MMGRPVDRGEDGGSLRSKRLLDRGFRGGACDLWWRKGDECGCLARV